MDVTQPNANVRFVHSLVRSSLLLFQDRTTEYEVDFSLAFTNLEFEVSSCMERAPGKACVSLAALRAAHLDLLPPVHPKWCNTGEPAEDALKQACSSNVLPCEQMHIHLAPIHI